jgi:hypothetical protein
MIEQRVIFSCLNGGAEAATACSRHNRTIRNIVLIRVGGMQKQKRGKPQPLKKTPFPFRRRDAVRIQVVTLNELARVLVRLDHVASVGVNAHHRIM